MRKTFEELVNDYMESKRIVSCNDLSYSDWMSIVELVRFKTLEEVANKAEAGYDHYKDEFDSDVIECYVFKQSILSLDKNSIEI